MTATRQKTEAQAPQATTDGEDILNAVVHQTTLEEQFVGSADKENLLAAYKLANFTERQKLLRAATAEMTRIGWGGNISDATRGAIARWGLENDVDPLRHLDVLGNQLYANAKYYYDKVAALDILDRNEVIMMAPLVDLDVSALPVSEAHKKRLKAEAEEINAECLSLQMRHRVPEALNNEGEAAAAALVRLHWKDGTVSEGVNWAGSYQVKRKSKTGQAGRHDDPVGSENPVKTAITRAFRKAAMQKVSVHKFAKGDEGASINTVTRYIEADREEAKRPELPPQASYVKTPEDPNKPALPPLQASELNRCGNPYETATDPEEEDIRREDAEAEGDDLFGEAV